MSMMDETERNRLRQRWQQIEGEVPELYEGKVHESDPADRTKGR